MFRGKLILFLSAAVGLVAVYLWVACGPGSFGEPSAEDAQQAILAHVTAHPDGSLAAHTPGDMATTPFEGRGGTVTWGPYTIDLSGRTFELTAVYGGAKRHGVSVKGRFVYTGGRWVAEAP